MDQDPEDIDELEEQLEAVDPGHEISLSWASQRSTGAVTVEGTVQEHDSGLLYMTTDERKSDIGVRRRGQYEIGVNAISGNRNESIGWLVDVEVLTETRVGHCRHDDVDVYIGRGENDAHLLNTDIGERGWLGNPFHVDDHGRGQCIERFRAEFEARLQEDDEFREAVAQLKGKVLGCWCQRLEEDGPACHGEAIAEWVDRLVDDDQDALVEPAQRDLEGNPTGQATLNVEGDDAV
jgi:hypothetical protein